MQEIASYIAQGRELQAAREIPFTARLCSVVSCRVYKPSVSIANRVSRWPGRSRTSPEPRPCQSWFSQATCAFRHCRRHKGSNCSLHPVVPQKIQKPHFTNLPERRKDNIGNFCPYRFGRTFVMGMGTVCQDDHENSCFRVAHDGCARVAAVTECPLRCKIALYP